MRKNNSAKKDGQLQKPNESVWQLTRALAMNQVDFNFLRCDSLVCSWTGKLYCFSLNFFLYFLATQTVVTSK